MLARTIGWGMVLMTGVFGLAAGEEFVKQGQVNGIFRRQPDGMHVYQSDVCIAEAHNSLSTSL